MDDINFDIPVNIKSELDKKIVGAFSMYDFSNNKIIDSQYVGMIMRSLGCVPTEKEIQEFIKDTEFEKYPGKIHLSLFLKFLKNMILAKKMVPASPEALLDAFKILDAKNRGKLRKNELVKLMTDYGEEMTEIELNEMLQAAVDANTNEMNYEKYLNQLVYEPDDENSIYKLADK